MTRGKSQRRPNPAWSMFPSLHDDVSRLLDVEGHPFTFHNVDNDIECIRSYDTAIMGRFHCRSRNCQSKTWSSKQIAVTIRMYPEQRYNARVYHQRCEACNTLRKPILDDSYADRVAYRLLKWSGVEQEPPAYSGESRGPHRSELCEGCRAGHCAQGNLMDGLRAQFSNFSLGGT
ncbi:zinc-binding domain-containing protein [Cadophora sp. MPI-SDFR-AT-0126]|nr:zinc-binding domain-containing protein [Leotiomycetes sp. MPI-SDFR-AT-0126]